MAEQAAPTPIYSVVFDTDILSWYLRGNEKALRAIEAIAYSRRAISALSLMELIQGCRNSSEVRQIKVFISENFPQLLYFNEITFRKAIELLENHALSNGLRIIDGLIAATALDGNASLASANIKHYRFISNLHLLPFKP